MQAYKLTTQDMTTHAGFQWTEGEWVPELDGDGELCSRHWYHFYTTPRMATYMNSAHANISNPRLWECEVSGIVMNEADVKASATEYPADRLNVRSCKIGATTARLVREIELPVITTEQRAEIAAQIAYAVYPLWSEYDKDSKWLKWYESHAADAAYAAYAAYAAAYAADAADAARAAADAAYAARAARAADAARAAARAAAHAVDAAYAERAAAHAAAHAADAAYAAYAAYAAAYAADAADAARAAADIDITAIVEQVCKSN